MWQRPFIFASVTILLVMAATLRGDAAQERRVALIIANGDYAFAPDLPNPVNDAKALADALAQVGFTDIERPASNLTQAGMLAAINAFAAKAREADVAVVYYAGHGVEIEGRNYLVPVDARLDRPDDVDDFTAVPLDLVLKAVNRARRLKLVILDACRNNPFASKWALAPGGGKTRSFGGRGLAPVPQEGDTLVAYAAEAGTEASDGPRDGNSPFVRALVRHLPAPGVEIRLMFGKVRDDVVTDTGGKQRPFVYGSLGGNEFYFRGKDEVVAGPDPAKGKKPGESFRDCPDCPEMVIVPAGSFMMGSPENEAGRSAAEGPQRRVTIAANFAVGKFEVTFDEWDACVKAGGCFGYLPPDQGWGRGRRPVIHVGWTDAQAYLKWLNRMTGRTYRLLSGAEWEYAARAGTTTAYCFGDTIASAQANFNGAKTVTVGSFPANKFGLFDMHGNVWEWTEDCFNSSYNSAPSDGRAWTTGDCTFRVVRGGSWFDDPRRLRSANRSSFTPTSRFSAFGFRVARTL